MKNLSKWRVVIDRWPGTTHVIYSITQYVVFPPDHDWEDYWSSDIRVFNSRLRAIEYARKQATKELCGKAIGWRE